MAIYGIRLFLLLKILFLSLGIFKISLLTSFANFSNCSAGQVATDFGVDSDMAICLMIFAQ